MATQILIDGTDYTTVVGGLESLTISLQKDDSTKTVNTVLSSTLTFYSEAYDYLQNKFFDVPESKNLESEITIITDCCGDEYNLLLRGDALTICFADCTIEGQLAERSQDLEAFNSIRNTVNTEAVLSGDVTEVQIETCKDADFLSLVLFALVEVLDRIIQALNVILNIFGINVLSGFEDFQQALLGCGFQTFGFRVSDVMRACANNAGLTFESSIFDNPPYNNLYYLNSNGFFNTLTCQQFLDLMTPVFNADYQIRNGVLYFERKDFFLQSVVELVNVEEVYADGKADNAPCYTYTSQNENALGRFEYSSDGQDDRANDILDLTNDIVEWNPGNQYPNRVGEFTRTIPFAPARFTRDRDSNAQLDSLRPDNALIVGQAPAQYPKLVIGDLININNTTPTLRPQRRLRNDASGRYDYTYQMWFDAALDVPELYQQFHFIEDPNITPIQPYQLEDFTFVATCDQIQLVRDNGVDVFVTTRLGKGRPQSIDINYDNKTITVKGVQIEIN